MEWKSVGMMTFPIWWNSPIIDYYIPLYPIKNIIISQSMESQKKVMFQRANQGVIQNLTSKQWTRNFASERSKPILCITCREKNLIWSQQLGFIQDLLLYHGRISIQTDMDINGLWQWIDDIEYTLWLSNVAIEKSPFLIGKPIYKWAMFHGYVK